MQRHQCSWHGHILECDPAPRPWPLLLLDLSCSLTRADDSSWRLGRLSSWSYIRAEPDSTGVPCSNPADSGLSDPAAKVNAAVAVTASLLPEKALINPLDMEEAYLTDDSVAVSIP